VAGDQTNIGGQQAFGAAEVDVRAVTAELRRQLGAVALPAQVGAAVLADAEAIDAEVRGRTPDRRSIADRLARLTQVLGSAGALATAGAALLGPLRALAGWLGVLGEPVRRLLAD